FLFFFLFSSRRRHTRFKCDWSSDVCSSDLWSRRRHGLNRFQIVPGCRFKPCLRLLQAVPFADTYTLGSRPHVCNNLSSRAEAPKIGRASCRERVWIRVVEAALEGTRRAAS